MSNSPPPPPPVASATSSLQTLIEQLRNYEVAIKNNLLNDESLNQYIETIQSNIVWKNDVYYQEQLSLFKDSSENISNSCTKFTKLITLKVTIEAISSIVDEIKIHSHNLYTYFSVLIIHPLGKPLYKLFTNSILGLLHHLIGLINIGLSNNFVDLNSIIGIIWEICGKIKVIPISNKAAFKRNFLENIYKIKDVIREFNGYVDASINNINNDDTNIENDIEKYSDDDNEFYNNEELLFVQKCIKLMEVCIDTLKVSNDVMTIVADNADNDLINENNKIICRIWVNKLVALSDNIDECVINLGAELYAPIMDINEVESSYYTELYHQLCSVKDLIIKDNTMIQQYIYRNNTEATLSNDNSNSNNECILALENIIQQINLLG